MLSISLKDPITYEHIKAAHAALSPHIIKTPIISSTVLNTLLGHEIFFKLENQQITGSFKIRGVLNKLLDLKKKNSMINTIVTYGTGNHAIALSYATPKFFDARVEVFIPSFAAPSKIHAIQKNGATLHLTKTRQEAEERAQEAATNHGAVLIPPSSDPSIVAGAGTVVYEALQEMDNVAALFVPLGGGSLASGSLIAANSIYPDIQVFAGEPKNANDAAISVKQGKIFRFQNSPETLADGAKTLGVTPMIFEYIKNLDGIIEISEREIAYWTVWFTRMTQISCEPTSALALAAAIQWLKTKKTPQKVLVVISGSNTGQEIYQSLCTKQYTCIEPNDFQPHEE